MAQIVSTVRVPETSPQLFRNASLGSPQGYAEFILRHIGVCNLNGLAKVFLGDVGTELVVRERRFRRGVQFRESSVPLDQFARVGWVLFERLPGAEGGQVRARAFRTFEGAAAEFSLRLRLHETGEVSVGKLSHSRGGMRLSFKGAGRVMVIAPFELAAEEASFLR